MERLSLLERQLHLLKQLQLNVEENIALLEKMRSKFLLGSVLFYNLDLGVLEATISTKYDLLPNLRLNASLDAIRYRLGHISHLIDLHLSFSFEYFLELSKNKVVFDNREKLRNWIHTEIKNVMPKLYEIRDIIDEQQRIIEEPQPKA